MGLEAATFVSQLVSTNPISSDQRKQGDDHLRLLKAVLQSSLPNLSRAFYIPTTEGKSAASYTVVAADMNKTFHYDTTAGDRTLTLLGGLTAADVGWSVRVIKWSGEANGVKVVPASGTINTRNGSLASVRVGVKHDVVEFQWDGSVWNCYKAGPNVGSVEEYYGSALPPGYLWADGTTFVAADFAELNIALGGNTLPDRRGRVVAARDNQGTGAAGRLSGAGSLKAGLGAETHTLTTAEIPSHNHNPVAITDPGHNHQLPDTVSPTNGGGAPNTVIGSLGATNLTGSRTTGISASTANTGGGGAHANVQPTYTCNAIVRAC